MSDILTLSVLVNGKPTVTRYEVHSIVIGQEEFDIQFEAPSLPLLASNTITIDGKSCVILRKQWLRPHKMVTLQGLTAEAYNAKLKSAAAAQALLNKANTKEEKEDDDE